nr:MAG TPA: HNH endonuclease [Caudoviricetes sp.]
MQREHEEVKAFYQSTGWRKIRNTYLAMQNNLCERCAKKGVINTAKIVHHKVYININNIHDVNITMNFKNLEALCQDCHNKEHFKRKNRFDENGNLLF